MHTSAISEHLSADLPGHSANAVDTASVSDTALSDLAQAASDALGANGPLARLQAGFRPRPGQVDMAVAVAEAIEHHAALVVEAGTGVGKTFAYLVPALLSGERVVLSTATKALQDQLFGRDLPRVLQALNLPMRAAMLKGRSSYLCTHHLQAARQLDLHDQAHGCTLAEVELWAQVTRTGDLAELANLDERSGLAALVSSTRDNCLGSACPQWRTCHVNQARREAMAADVVVVNHHLLFADMSVREAGVAELLPLAGVVVVDEAHQLNDIGLQCLGEQWGSAALHDLAHALVEVARPAALGMADWHALAAELHACAAQLLQLAQTGGGPGRYAWRYLAAQPPESALDKDAGLGQIPTATDVAQPRESKPAERSDKKLKREIEITIEIKTDERVLKKAQNEMRAQAGGWDWPLPSAAPDAGAPEGVHTAAWAEALAACSLTLHRCAEALAQASQVAPSLAPVAERCDALCRQADVFASPEDASAVRWLELSAGAFRLVESPHNVAASLRSRLMRNHPLQPDAHAPDSPLHDQLDHQPAVQSTAAETAYSPTAWIFTSATLGDDKNLDWFTEPCGLRDARTLRVASPFDYAAQAALYVPVNAPAPSDLAHSPWVAELAADAALALGGRTLVLTTTLRALRHVADALRARLSQSPRLAVLAQGDMPKRWLMERFRAGHTDDSPGCILVATASFWEGFDVPGDSLQLVIIDKLPFPPPGDPLVVARMQRVESAGRNAFAHHAVPEAAVALRQGAGRLIRSETDRGILVVCDRRLVQQGYGKRLLRSLPSMRMLSDAAAFNAALADLACSHQPAGQD